MFPLPDASVKTPAATSIDVAAASLGVNVAVYTVELEDAKLLNAPPDTVTSSTTKLVVASFEVNVNSMDESLLVSPSETVELVIVIVGDTVSIAKSANVSELEFPPASVTVIVFPL